MARADGATRERDLARLEQRWMEAVRDRDLAHLERLLGEEFTLTTGRPGAEVRSREDYLRITAEDYELEDFEFEELRARIYGHVAVVDARYRQRARMAGEDRTQAFRMTDVIVRRAGRWQVVSRHATPLAP